MYIERYTAEWCGPCRMFGPIVEKVGEETNTTIDVVDVDENPEQAQEHNIRSLPTIIYRDNEGTEIGRVVGVVPKSEIINFIEENG